MTDKIATTLEDFDFGFSLVDADELEQVQSLTKEIETTSSTAEGWQQQAEQWKQKAEYMYKAVAPLLNNLSANPEKEYIYWPDRVDKIQAFKLKLMQILED